jgi:Mg-chelatase subunit ChlD
MLLLAAILVLAVVAFYWWRFGIWSNRAYSIPLLAALLALLAVLIYANRTDRELLRGDVPTLIAIASDVSLSMGTAPDPRVNDRIGTRLERVQDVLLPLLAELDASTAPVMVGVTAFTSKSETILSWDDNLPQVREVVEYVLTTGLLTEPGSDLGAALLGAVPLFEILPEQQRDREQNKFLIIVSDGEQTVTQTDVAAAITELREIGVKIIAVYVGMQDVSEGLAVYDDIGNFMGFDEVGGQIYSVPDPDIMQLVAGNEPSTGIFVDAEDSDAADTIMNFVGVSASKTISGPLYLTLVLTLWTLSVVVLLWFV